MLSLRSPLCPGKKQRVHEELMSILGGSESSVGLPGNGPAYSWLGSGAGATVEDAVLMFPKLTTEWQHQATSEGEKTSPFRTRKVKPVTITI